MNRPTGVTILGWIAVVFGAIGLVGSILGAFAALALMFAGAGLAGAGGVAGGAVVAGSAFMLLALTIWTAILSAIEIAFGVGALQLKPWAWSLGTIWTWVSMASTLLTLIANKGSGLFSALLSIIVAIAILYYLYTDEVRAAFGKSDKAAPGFIVPVFEQINKMLASGRGGQPPQAPAGYQPPQTPGGYQPPQAPANYQAPPAPPADAPAPPAPPAPPA
jgi:hypothetical protein